MQRCFSASATHEKGEVMSGDLRVEMSFGGFVGGWQLARVKLSTSLRMKKRGKVPPRFEALGEVSEVCGRKKWSRYGGWGREGQRGM